MLTMTSEKEEEVYCECSDEEMYNPGKAEKGSWEPRAEDMLKIFEELKTKKVLELSWKCPGRRPPESDEPKEEEIKEEQAKTPPKEELKKPAASTEFDFDDDFQEEKTVLTPRRTPGSAPKSEKKVARMSNVLKDLMMQRKKQAAEREARKMAKSPRNPSSPGRAKVGSPAGSPRTPSGSAHSNRQSPIRSMDNIHTTPLRAPMELESAMRNQTLDPTAVVGGMSNRGAENNVVNSGMGHLAQANSGRLTPSNSGRSTPSGSGRLTPSGSGRLTPSNSGRLTPSRQGYPQNRPLSGEMFGSLQQRENSSATNNHMSSAVNTSLSQTVNRYTPPGSSGSDVRGEEQKDSKEVKMETS